jgi:hypothetical protein
MYGKEINCRLTDAGSSNKFFVVAKMQNAVQKLFSLFWRVFAFVFVLSECKM